MLGGEGWGGGAGAESVALHVDCVQRVWTLMRRTGDGGASEAASKADRDLRPGVWHELRVEMRGGNTMTVFCDQRGVFQSHNGGRPEQPAVTLQTDRWKAER